MSVWSIPSLGARSIPNLTLRNAISCIVIVGFIVEANSIISPRLSTRMNCRSSLEEIVTTALATTSLLSPDPNDDSYSFTHFDRFQPSLPPPGRLTGRKYYLSPVLARCRVDLLHAAIVLYDPLAELRSQSDDAPFEEDHPNVQRALEYWKKRLAAARDMAEVARKVDDLSILYAQTCLAVSDFEISHYSYPTKS